MSQALIEVVQSYTLQTTNATPQTLLHNTTGPFHNTDPFAEFWGHWTIRGTAREVGQPYCKHFYQRLSGIWTVAVGMIYTGTQPAQESETAASMSAASFAIGAGSPDDIQMIFTGIVAKTINWFFSVKTHNVYTETGY